MSESSIQNFNHLKIHSQYSICEGAIKIDDLQNISKSNLINLLLTSPGERVFQPSFGSNLRAILFDSFDTVTPDNIDEAIREAVNRQLPYITINEVNVVQDGQNENSILVSIEYSTTLEPDTLDSLTLQFNIGE